MSNKLLIYIILIIFFSINVSAYGIMNSSIKDNLIHYYPLSSSFDIVNSYNLSNGTGVYTSAKILNGVNNSIYGNRDFLLNTSSNDNYTVCTWVNQTNELNTGQVIAGLDNNTGRDMISLGQFSLIYTFAADQIQFGVNDWKDYVYYSYPRIGLIGNWSYICAAKNVTDINLYLNGVYVNRTHLSTTWTSGQNKEIILNRNSETAANNPNAFTIDELGLWQKTLSASEVSYLYNGGTGLGYFGLLENSITYNSTTFETNLESFILNFTADNPLYVNVVLNYNGTSYNSNTTCLGNNCLAINSFNIPTIVGNQQNNTFYWTITVFDGISYYVQNSSVNNQSVNSFSLTQCTSGDIALNFTSYDEQNRSRLNPFDFQGEFQYALSPITTSYKTLNISNSSTPEVDLCINYNATYYINSIIAYSAPRYTSTGSSTTSGNSTDSTTTTTPGLSYPIRNYFYQNHQIRNITQKVPLYLLKSSSSTSFILQVEDNNILPVGQVLIEAQKCYTGLNINETVFISRTNANGMTTGNLEAETALYQFFITNNSNTLLAVTPCSAVVPQSAPYTLLFQIGGSYVSPFTNINNATDITSTLFFNATDNILTWTYIDTSSSFINASLVVRNLNYSGNNNPIFCNGNSSLSSGIITCNMSTAGTYSASVYIYRTGQNLIDQTVFTVQTFASTVGYYGAFLAFFIILISAFAFKWNEIAGIWIMNISVIFVNLIGLVAFGPVFITAMLCISVIITAILER